MIEKDFFFDKKHKATLANLITLSLPEDSRFVPKDFRKEWESGGFVERKRALEVWDYVQMTAKDESRVGAYLAGPMGEGKSSIMLYVVQRARALKWFVIYIPCCDDWADAGTESNLG